MKVTVSRQELAAALLFASIDETRYVINGVLIEVRAGKQPLIVATDGRRLVSIESVAAQDEPDCIEDHSFVLSPGFIKPICALVRTLGSKELPWLTLDVTPGSKKVGVAHVGGFFTLECRELALIDSPYPNWRGSVPAKSKKREPVTHIGINASFVGDFSKAAKILGSNTPVIQMSLVGKEASVEIVLSGVTNFYGLVMQCVPDESVEYQPEFLAIVKAFPMPQESEDEKILEDIEAVPDPETAPEPAAKKKRTRKKEKVEA